MKLLIFNIIFLILFPYYLKAQSAYPEPGNRLAGLFARLDSVSDENGRLSVNDSICRIVSDYAESDSVFSHSFKGVRRLGQIMSPDSALKIISWNLLLDNYSGKYFSYIIRRGKGDGKNRVYSLNAPYSSEVIITDTIVSSGKWYGALYYDVRPVILGSEKLWIVLGLDYGDPMVTRKIIDVISFDENGSVIFGKKWFETPGGLKYRAVFEYVSTGMMTLRFTSDSSIVFDHLVPVNTGMKDSRTLYGPDYSYDAYAFENGVWKFRTNVDARNPE